MTRVLYSILAVLSALVVGVVVLFTYGAVAAAAAMLAVLAIGIGAVRGKSTSEGSTSRLVLRVITAGLFVFGLVAIGCQVRTITNAFTDVSDAVPPADAQSLASARQKFDEVGDSAAFRVEIHESELTAVAQDGLAGADAPFRSIELDITDDDGDAGAVYFEAESRNGDLVLRGHFKIQLVAGVPTIEMVDVDLGILTIPGIGQGAVEDLINPFVSDALAGEGIEIQSIELANDSLIVTGMQSGGEIISSRALLGGLQADSIPQAVAPPAERYGPGIVNDTIAEGSVYYVALGDSLAANVGVAEARDGYVSRLHRQLEEREQTEYGLRNFGVPGETSASLIRAGQLRSALEFIESHDVRYVTLNVGANDLLGHLTSKDCSESVSGPRCQQRIRDSFTAFESNLSRILTALREAAPDAEMLYLQTYNPFSLGYESRVAFEEDSNRIVGEFNELAAGVAESHGVLVADGFTPLRGTTAATTHILDSPPDIHPRAIGFDILAGALLDALPQ